MSERWGWGLVALLAALTTGQAAVLLAGRETHAVLPIFVPVSAEHERTMREARGQPPGRGGEEAVEAVRRVERMAVDPATAAAVAPQVERLKALRLELLAARDERHRLNTRMMEVGVELGRVLTPEQWEEVVSKRDAVRARADAALFDRVLAGMR